jgi:hypothetical protein
MQNPLLNINNSNYLILSLEAGASRKRVQCIL